ncbi:uncharacterized protein C4orf51 homolog isoform X2 [Notamacropus eugenii]|uniref:uncharacterized protein C4orf51 homolog isoform X2 n=1 Tax=Notamacropus eugenii TaxID=9315 RepID=UPI003B6776B6
MKKLSGKITALNTNRWRIFGGKNYDILFLVNKIHYLPGYYHCKAREPEKMKVPCPEITTFFKDSLNVKRRVMHQIVTPDTRLPAYVKNFDIRSRTGTHDSLKSTISRRRAFSSQAEGIGKWSSSSEGSQISVPRSQD